MPWCPGCRQAHTQKLGAGAANRKKRPKCEPARRPAADEGWGGPGQTGAAVAAAPATPKRTERDLVAVTAAVSSVCCVTAGRYVQSRRHTYAAFQMMLIWASIAIQPILHTHSESYTSFYCISFLGRNYLQGLKFTRVHLDWLMNLRSSSSSSLVHQPILVNLESSSSLDH